MHDQHTELARLMDPGAWDRSREGLFPEMDHDRRVRRRDAQEKLQRLLDAGYTVAKPPTTDTTDAAAKLHQLRTILHPVIAWYEQTLNDGEPDSSYLYDTTCEQFPQRLSRGDYQQIIEIVRTT